MADVLCTVKVRAPVVMGARCHVAVGQEVFFFGGTNTDRYLNVHVFNTVSLKWTRVFPRDDTCYKDNRQVPYMRWFYTGVLIDNVIYICGGRTRLEFCSNVLLAFDVDTNTWLDTEVSGTVPEGRYFHTACVSGQVMYVHGGLTQTGGRTNDICKLDTTTMVWSSIESGGSAPPVSYGHSATMIGTKMFVFGGFVCKDNSNSISSSMSVRVFDTESNLWLTMPSAQCHPNFAYNGELYTFGDPAFEDENALPMLSWKKVKPKGNGPFPHLGGSCCVVGDRVVVFGYDDVSVYILELSPSLKTLCKLAVLQYGLDQSELPHDIREELAAMTMTDNHID